ncbi:hypothetical protein B7486_74690, partial [cyanobacterium TDX16]
MSGTSHLSGRSMTSGDASSPLRRVGSGLRRRDVVRRRVGPVIEVPLVQLDPDLPVPAYARPGDAGVDLRAREPRVLRAGGGRALVPTGVRIAIPEGCAG